MSQENKTVWIKRPSKRSVNPLLQSRVISREWLATDFESVEVSFSGPLLSALVDLSEASKGKNLPTGSLRLLLQSELDGVISVGSNLGGEPGNQGEAAVVLYPSGEADALIATAICDKMGQWYRDNLDPWAKRAELLQQAARVQKHIDPANIVITPSRQRFFNPRTNRPEFPIISRQIAERLAGEELFPGMGPCEIVYPRSGSYADSIELMTRPKRTASGKKVVFSMVATVRVSSVPYSSELYFTVNAAKRVWADKMPNGFNTGRRATGYVFAPNRPTIPVGVTLQKKGDEWFWDFDEEYAAFYAHTSEGLKGTLAEALAAPYSEEGWWAGLPQTTRLYSSVAPRTVFEGDDDALLEAAESRLSGILAGPVNFTRHPLVLNKPPAGAMLKSEDFGVAGVALNEDDEDGPTEGDNEAVDKDEAERRAVATFREQCIEVLAKTHGAATPHLWVIGGNEQEQDLIKQAANKIFGYTVGISCDPMPAGVHGLKEQLPGKGLKSRQRFDERVKAWQSSMLLQKIAKHDGHRFVLICAPKQIGRKSEDSVNRRAAIHAVCSMANASVHHVLPVEPTNYAIGGNKAVQAFIHRTQSALMDVMLAHSGYIIGAGAFAERCLGKEKPRYVYGIHALRKQAQKYTGEAYVCMTVYTRLDLNTNITEIQFGYRESNRTQRSDWMALHAGLIWLACQRNMQGDENWLKDEFTGLTSQVLAEAQSADPHAVVLINWETLNKLWRELTDQSLSRDSTLKLGHINLGTSFPEMSFVRLRCAPGAAMALRNRVEWVYEGYREETTRVATGEFYTDTYVTSTNQLIEINPGPESAHRAHFVGAMKYRSTFQLPRGLSCYRSTVRIVKDKANGKEEKIYEKATKEPAEIDATLPASIDITVLQSPARFAADRIASLVMGLRLGYAHYNDWTRLPAPLFFERKIDDYIIKYPESEEEAPLQDSGETREVMEAAVESDSEGLSSVLQLITEELVGKTVANQEVQEETGGQRVVETVVPDGAKGLDSCVESESKPDVLEQAKAIAIAELFLYSAGDMKIQRLHRQMIRGRFDVRVDLPAFVRMEDLVFPLGGDARSRINRHWKDLVRFEYVGAGERRKPNDQYLKWLTDHFIRPQGAYIINPRILFDKRIIVPGLARALNQYNAHASTRIDVHGTNINLAPLVRDVIAREDDDTLAWIVFAAAQTPAHGIAESSIPEITSVIGPKTLAALHYYVACADAVRQAIEQVRNPEKGAFKPIHITPYTPPELMVTKGSDGIQGEPERAGEKIKAATPHVPSENSMRVELVALAKRLVPGSETFQTDLAKLDEIVVFMRQQDEVLREEMAARAVVEKARRNEIEACAAAEASRLEEERAEALRAQRELEEKTEALQAEANAIIERICTLDEEQQIGAIQVNLPEPGGLEVAADEAVRIRGLVEGLANAKNALDAFYGTPLPLKASFSERAAHSKRSGELLNNVMKALETARGGLIASRLFVLEENGEQAEKSLEAVSAATQESTEQESGTTESAPAAALPESAAANLEPEPVAYTEPIAPVVEDSTESDLPGVVEEPPAGEVSASGTTERDLLKALGCVSSMIEHRHYALAHVYAEALGVAFADQPKMADHAKILAAFCDALDSIDCRFAIDPRLDARLRKLLGEPYLEACDCAGHVASAIGVLGASMVSILFPTTEQEAEGVRWSVIDWVRNPLTGIRSLAELVEHIGQMDNKGIHLTREKLVISGIGEKLAMQAEDRRMAERAAHWKTDESLDWNYASPAFTRMHDYIFGISHPIGQCLAVIAKGDTSQFRNAYERARRELSNPERTVKDVFRRNGDLHKKPDGQYNVNAVANITATRKFIEEYLVRAEAGSKTQCPLTKNEEQYLDTLISLLQSAGNELASMKFEHALDGIYAGGLGIILNAVLRLFDNTEATFCIPEIQQRLLIQLPMDKTFMPSMTASEESGVRALCTAEDVMRRIDDLLDEEISELPTPLTEESLLPLLGDALRSHVQERRFLPAFAIAAISGVQARLEPTLLQQYQKSKADLARELQDARQRVTHAMALSALHQNEATELLQVIEVLSATNAGERSIGHPEGLSSAYPDFPHALGALRTHVLQVLDTRLQETRDRLLAEVEQAREKQDEDAAQDLVRIYEMLKSNNPATLRTAHDAMMIVRGGGRLPQHPLTEGKGVFSSYEAFIESLATVRSHHVFIDSLQGHLRDDTEEHLPQCIRHLDANERAEAAGFLDSWKALCDERNPSKVADMAGKFFESIGIGAPTLMPEARRSRHTVVSFPARAFGGLSNECFIPPALGSPARGVYAYIVSGLNPENDLSALIQDIAGIPTFILSRAKLTPHKRARLTGHAPALLLDDYLVAYMALHPETRGRLLLEVGLLTFYTQPYSADGTSVPKEMFFGRRRELDSLRNIKSLAVLYGGRRLGKSSLLAQIEREMNQTPRVRAIYLAMNRDYHGGDHVLYAWRTIVRALAAEGVIDPLPKDETQWRNIRTWVESQLTANAQRFSSLYLLLDEADDLMGRELDLKGDEIGIIGSLHQMVESIQSRINIRYVIAGLHNLTRMTTESNSALGKAEVIALEPFNTDDDILRGIQLVTKPMASLGFFFGEGSENLPLRILSVCNYYPAFIQVYCKKLVEHMYNKRPKDALEATVEASDIDAVEKDHDLLTELQTKFGWTLDLDKRYKAIALILADIYYSEIELGRNEGLPVGEIRSFCQMMAEPHFRGLSGGAYESLVDEMRKLNVLEKHGANYRLRNPSIAMLIGDRERIRHQLDMLASEPPEKLRNQGDRRPLLVHGDSQYVFPMPIAWTTSHMDVINGNLVVLTGNHRSGLVELWTSNHEWQLTQNGFFRSMNLPVSAVDSQIQKYRRQAQFAGKGRKHFNAVVPTAWKVADIPSFVNLASKAASQRLRLALVANPDKMWEMVQAMRQGSLAADGANASWEVAPVPPWSMDAVRFLMHENVAIADNTEACEAILRATCGFTSDIRMLCNSKLKPQDALRAFDVARKSGFAQSKEVFYKHIGMPTAIDVERLRSMENFMGYLNNELRDGDIVNELMKENNLEQEDLMFLNWMGLLQEGAGNRWVVPELYLSIIS